MPDSDNPTGNVGHGRRGIADGQKLTTSGRDAARMVLQSLDRLGGAAYLEMLGREEPVAFASLIRAIIPRNVDLSGVDGAPMVFHVHRGDPPK